MVSFSLSITANDVHLTSFSGALLPLDSVATIVVRGTSIVVSVDRYCILVVATNSGRLASRVESSGVTTVIHSVVVVALDVMMVDMLAALLTNVLKDGGKKVQKTKYSI